MKQSKTRKLSNSELRRAQALQVQEYIDRYHPELRGCRVVISRDRNFASIREVPAGKLKAKKPKK